MLGNKIFVGVTVRGILFKDVVKRKGKEYYKLKCSHCDYEWEYLCDDYWKDFKIVCPNGCIHSHKISCIVDFYDVETEMHLGWRTLRLHGEFSDVYQSAYNAVRKAEEESLYGYIAFIENTGRKCPSISNKGGRFKFVP